MKTNREEWTMDRKAKIVATIGPSCKDEAMLRKLIQAGLDVARLNFSHGTHEDHAKWIECIRSLSNELHHPVTILQDLQGPKLRVGWLPPEGVHLTAGQAVLLKSVASSAGETPNLTSDPLTILLDIPDLTHSLSPGKRILLDDGNLELEIVEIDHDIINTKVVLGGVLTSHKGVNFPGAHLDIPGFTEKDHEDLIFGLQQGVDAVAISFVRTAGDIEIIRETIKQFDINKALLPIIAKLELPQAIDNLHEIIHAADGVMVARGDLGVETSAARVPILQKEIIQSANRHTKTVITATQMLDSMIHNPRPTRAEASDVANAIFDGTDAVMLSGETASGEYPIESIQMMDSIVREAEYHFTEWGSQHAIPEEPTRDDAISTTRAARELAHDRNVAAVAVFTQTGKSAVLMSKARPQVPILAFTPEVATYQRMGLVWGVTPFLVPFAKTVEGMIAIVEQAILSSTSIQPGQQVVVVTGFPIGEYIQPNMTLLHTIGEK
jgi:pyruvate kinase